MQLQLEFLPPGTMSIKDRVLWILQTNEWVTTTDFLDAGLYTFRNRISELRAEGYKIDAQKIEGKGIYRYRLVS